MNTNLIELEERRLEKLPPHELHDSLMQLPAGRRLDVILQRPDAEAIVATMAAQDFYFTVKELGPDMASSLLALARVEQLNHLFDLEWWQRDQLLPARSVEWLEALVRADERKFLSWLYQADYELLVALFKKWIRVVTAPEEVDLTETRDQLPRHTLDDQFFWEGNYPQYEDFFNRILGFLFEVHHNFYVDLMSHIMWAADVEMEEDAYRFHRGRLEDQAVPDFYDALEIYRAVHEHEIPHNKETMEVETIIGAVPSFALALVPEEDLLSRTVREIREIPLIETLQLELASLANKVIVADQISFDTPENLREAVDKAVAAVNLGLHLKSAGNPDTAVKTVREVFLEFLFRLGQTQVIALKHRLQKIRRQGWLSRWPAGLHILDTPWLEAAELLLGKTPRLLRTEPDKPSKEDFFRTPQDVHSGNQLIDTISAVGALFEALHVEPEGLQEVLWPEGQIRSLEDVTLGTLLWTAAARFESEKIWEAAPIPVQLWPTLFPRLKPEAVERAVRSWTRQILPDEAERSRTEAYLKPLFEAYATEMASFSQGPPPDPQFVRFFLFTG